ncbi:hypothetical protein Agub_g1863, partial [Astrephomene gubernaculifera]
MVLTLPSAAAVGVDLLRSILEDPNVQQANSDFVARIGESPVPATCRAACALMGEEALVDFSDDEWHVGSTDATTCLIAVLVCRTSRKAWAAHYNSHLARVDTSITQLLPRHMQHPEVWLVGSFLEPTGESAATLQAVLQLLHACRLPCVVRLACVAGANTDGAGAPRALHLAVGCSPGDAGVTVCCDASPAGFADRGPELPRRFAHDHMAESRGDV